MQETQGNVEGEWIGMGSSFYIFKKNNFIIDQRCVKEKKEAKWLLWLLLFHCFAEENLKIRSGLH